MKIFTGLIQKFRSSMFAEYLPMISVFLVVFVFVYFIFDKNDSDLATNKIQENEISSEVGEDFDWAKFRETLKELEKQEPPIITGNETQKEIYSNPYIIHIRTALNNYLNGSNIGAEEVIAMEEMDDMEECGLSKFDSSYYKSKFFLFDVDNSDYGGVQAWIVFKDKPDILFWTWVYRLGGDEEYSLRGFCEAGPPEDKRVEFIELMHEYINSDDFGYAI